jgi:dethiobiotin synthetase
VRIVMSAWFVTGTDTEVGKTYACCALLHALQASGLSALGMKPIAAGTDAEGRNDDVERLCAASSVVAPRELVNPYCFAEPVAPHVAAALAGEVIEPARIVAAFRRLEPLADALIVEGVGGFRVPLDDRHDTADLAVALGLPVILVVGIRLGCLNHALLTAEAIVARGLKFAGWIANCVDPQMAHAASSIDALQARLAAPLLGTLPYARDGESTAAARLTLPPL